MKENFSVTDKSSSDKKQKIALITGITGQDGSYLAEFLIKKIIRSMGLKEDQVVSTLKE